MAIPQQKFREIVFQLLYSKDIAQASEEEMTTLLMKELSVTKRTVKEALLKMNKVMEKIAEIDELIRTTSSSYRFERIQSIERNVLRLGVFELLFDDSVPPKVAIAEAMRLSRKFGTPESAIFVNALLDAIYKQSIGEELDRDKLSDSAEQLEKSEEIISEISRQEKSKDESQES